MDSKFSFLDQDGLFGDGSTVQPDQQRGPSDSYQQQQRAGRGITSANTHTYGSIAPSGGAANRTNTYSSQQPHPTQQELNNNGGGGPVTLEQVLSGPLDGIARALAYTEKRIASSEAKLLASLKDFYAAQQERMRPSPNGWMTAVAIVVIVVGLVALVACFRRRPSTLQPTLYMQGPATMAAPAAPSVVFPGATLAPPATFMG